MVTEDDIKGFIRQYALQNRAVCLHSSFKSIGDVTGGPDTIIDAFLSQNCTLMTPTHSWDYLTAPSQFNRPLRNAWDYSTPWISKELQPFTTQSTVIDPDMGIISQKLLNRKEAIRGNNPLCSLTALGPLAEALIKKQTPMNVTAPLKALGEQDGFVVCIGVDLTKVTLIHYIEELCERKPFIRWAMKDSTIIPVQVGGCSEGFNNLYTFISSSIIKTTLGNATCLIIPVNISINLLKTTIECNPEITCCNNQCPVCNDTMAGGPIY